MDDVKLKRSLLLVPCTTKEHLQNWFKTFLDFHVFDTISSRFATATPLDAAWEVYKFTMFPEQRTPRNHLFASARSTQKTITLAALEVAVLLHAKRTVLHFAGSKDQVEAGYQYVKKFLNLPLIRDLLEGDITQTQTELLIPDYDNKMWLDGKTSKEILKEDPGAIKKIKVFVKTISQFTTQGQHESFLGIDEIHTLKGEKRQAYMDIRKIPVSSWDGKPWARVNISSRKSPTSVVEQEIANKEKSGLIVKQWTVFEGVEQCPSDRHGNNFIHNRYINVYNGAEKTEEEFEAYDGKDKDKYSFTTLSDGCLNCPLRSVCMADLAKPKTYNKHHQSVESAIVDFVSDADRGWYIAQCLSLQPSREGIVFSRFDRNEFEKTPSEMYEIFTGESPGRDLSEDELIAFMLSKGVKAYAGLDHGYTDPMAIVVNYEDSVGTIYTMKTIAKQGLDPNQVVEEVRKIVDKYKITHLYPDTATPAINALIKKAKIVRVMDDFDKKDGIANGIALIRGKISPAVGPTKYYGLQGNCDELISEMEKYSYSTDSSGKFTDEPEDEFNHLLDAQRYSALNRWDKNSLLIKDNSNKPRTQEEEIAHYNQQVREQQAKYVSQEINKAIKENGGNAGGTKKSKSGGLFWDIG